MVHTSEVDRVHSVEVDEVEDYLTEVTSEYEWLESRSGTEFEDVSDVKELLSSADNAVLVDNYDLCGDIRFALYEEIEENVSEKYDEILVKADQIDDEQLYREMIE